MKPESVQEEAKSTVRTGMASRCEITCVSSGGQLYLSLAGAADIAAARELHEALVPLLSGSRKVSVDLAQVERLDGVGLQLLVAARVSVESAGGEFVFGAMSEPVREALEVAGALHGRVASDDQRKSE